MVSVSKHGIKNLASFIGSEWFVYSGGKMTFDSDPSNGDFRMKTQTQKQKPIHEVRLGFIKAAVWRNEVENGVRYNVTFSRIYKDGDNWNSTDSFGRNDLLLLAKVADQAHSWIFAQAQENESAGRTASNEHDDR